MSMTSATTGQAKPRIAPVLLTLAILLSASPLTAPIVQARPAPRAAAGEEDSIRYAVRRGDTLSRLAADYMVTLEAWRTVGRINRIAEPRAIPIGTMLTVPTRLLKAEPLGAHIITFRGEGRIEASGTATPLAVGLAVEPGMAIETGTGSFATLELSNGSRITLPSHTRLRVTAMRRFLLTGSVDFDFLLEKGRLETGATPLGARGGRYRIRTPIAVSAVRGTIFRIGYEEGGAPSLTEVIEGIVAVAPPGGHTETAVEKGFGASVAANGALTIEKLLPAPELLQPGRLQVDPLVTLSLAPLDGARAYHVQIARDAGFVDLEQETYVATPEIRFADVANGQWFVRATGVAASGLEGLPRTYTMRRMLTGLDGSAERDAGGGYRFRWAGPGEGRRVYHFRLRRDVPDSVPLVDEPGLSGDSLTLSDLPPGTYRWRVGVRQYQDGESTTNWLPEQELIVAPQESGGPAVRPN